MGLICFGQFDNLWLIFFLNAFECNLVSIASHEVYTSCLMQCLQEIMPLWVSEGRKEKEKDNQTNCIIKIHVNFDRTNKLTSEVKILI